MTTGECNGEIEIEREASKDEGRRAQGMGKGYRSLGAVEDAVYEVDAGISSNWS